MLTELFDRGWDACILAPIVWAYFDTDPAIAAGALVALCASFLSSYVRARGAALGYSIEESHVTRGLRYALVSAGLLFTSLTLAVWAAAFLSTLAAAVRTGQVAREERA
jgi:phosphatidylglycerophosphate synthase